MQLRTDEGTSVVLTQMFYFFGGFDKNSAVLKTITKTYCTMIHFRKRNMFKKSLKKFKAVAVTYTIYYIVISIVYGNTSIESERANLSNL